MLEDLKKEIKLIENLIKINNQGTQQQLYMNQAYYIVLESLKQLVHKYE